ncbi:MAG: hypothetical protein ACD_5C00305G0001, partial [uncultured bacterium]
MLVGIYLKRKQKPDRTMGFLILYLFNKKGGEFFKRLGAMFGQLLLFQEEKMARITRALISVSEKAGVVELAEALSGYGVEILSTGGTAR